MPAPTRPETCFARHGLSTRGLRPAGTGFSNEVWLADAAVLRLGRATRHAFEARVACGAWAAGVRTARPLFWGHGYGLWERLDGEVPAQVMPGVWAAVLDDLERLQAGPPLPRPRRVAPWRGDPAWIGRTQAQAAWTPGERTELERLLGTPYPVATPVFIHGDVYRLNLLVDAGGRYAGLLDWGLAGWSALEAEVAVMDDPAPALARWGRRLDPELLRRARLKLLLEVAGAGRVPFGAVQALLDGAPH
ncbi:phosphotransferase family protein [Deinococcus petrolearius]|uniref:Phosphotransferase family protein n=1 Tax=Deinococcus petrolearius TaxID=1751295 RepID=A0ABW1DH76_9DEIO